MRILLTNDDGIDAGGLRGLEKIAHTLAHGPHELWIVAPSEDMSAIGHAMTVSSPMQLKTHDEKRFSLTGTPADCVAFALKELMKDQPPDLVLSGINHGWNLGDDVLYSGTVGGAMEASLNGVDAIAVSAPTGYERQYASALSMAAKVIDALIQHKTPDHNLFFNINLPNAPLEEIKGPTFTEQASDNHLGQYDKTVIRYEKFIDPRGITRYWTGFTNYDKIQRPGTDHAAVLDNMISVTPLQYNLTDRKLKAALAKQLSWFL